MGVDLSRRAIRAARSDLEEALTLLRGESESDSGARPVLTTSSPVAQLTSDYEAMGGFWPAAAGFQTSAGNGLSAVTASYENIVTQVESVIELLNQAVRNYDGAETGSETRSESVQV
jgi:hypothetical protein